MNLIVECSCPFCGATTPIELDPGDGEAGLVVDCEVCCRPMRVVVECAAGEVIRVETQAA